MRQTMKTRRQVCVPRRKWCRLQLESLEARLPLGDALLSTLLGSSWLGATLATFRQDPWTMANAQTEARPAQQWSAQGGDLGLSPAERSSVPLALSRAAHASPEPPSSAQDTTAPQRPGGFGEMPAWEATNALQAKDLFFSLAALATPRTNRAAHSTGVDNSLVGAVQHSAPASAGQLLRDSSGLTEPRSVAATTSGGLNPAIPTRSGSDKTVASPVGSAGCPLDCGGTWGPTGSMMNYRVLHSATRLSNGKVLVAGGVDQNSAELYDPTTATWSTTGNTSSLRFGHQSLLLTGGQVMAIGGGRTFTEVYDPTTGAWTRGAPMSIERYLLGATRLTKTDDTILVAGGRNYDGRQIYSSAELYNPNTGVWTMTGSMSVPRQEIPLVLLDNGLVLAAGGYGGGASTAELYDPSQGTWSPTGSMNVGRGGYEAVTLGNGRVLVVGGDAFGTAELFDPSSGTWSLTGSMSVARYQFSLTLLADGRVLAAGAYGPCGGGKCSMINTAEIYDPSTGTWCSTASMGTGRAGHTATLIDTGSVLVSGGLTQCDQWGCYITTSAELFSP